jgi:DNA-binding NarL/FixJ family response regulator
VDDPSSTTVIIADDEPEVCRIAARLLARRYGKVVQVGSLTHLGVALTEAPAATLFLDLMWGETVALSLLPELLIQHPGIRTCMHSNYGAGSLVAASFRAGARGYLVKPATVAEFYSAVDCVASGDRYLSPELRTLPGLVDAIARGLEYRTPISRLRRSTPAYLSAVSWLAFDLRLTNTEAETALELSQRSSKKQVAGLRGCSEATVATHTADIYRKLRSTGVTNAASLARGVTESLARRPPRWVGASQAPWPGSPPSDTIA